MIKSHYHTCLTTILAFSIVSTTTFPRSTDLSFDDVAKASFIVGTVGLSTWGALKALSWLIGPSDETVTSKALESQRKALAHYMNLTEILAETYYDCPDKQACINDINEQVLYKLALAKYYDKDIKTYLRQLRSANSMIEKQRRKLHDRMKRIHMNIDNSTEAMRLYHKMKAIDKQLQELAPRLAFLYNYLKHHESYFVLFQVEDGLLYTYERDLQAIQTYQGDVLYAREIIHQSVMLQQRNNHELYPYRWYLRHLEEDIYMLQRTASTLTYEYTERYNVAYSLANRLEAVRATIVGSPYYIDELRTIEHAKIVNAALQASERQARAAERVADCCENYS